MANSTHAPGNDSSPLSPGNGVRLTNRSMAIRLFLTCWLVYVLHFATNTVREIFPALSLGDHLSFNVSEYLGFHPDIFELPGGKAAINNNPGASILGAIPYLLTRPIIDRVTDAIQQSRLASGQPAPEYKSIYPMAREFYRKAYERGLDVKFALAAGVMQALLMAPLAALSAVGMFYALYALTRRQVAALLLALLYAFATPVFYRVAQLNHNLLQAIFAWLAFLLLWRPWEQPGKPGVFVESDVKEHRDGFLHRRWLYYLAAGLLTGYTLVLDYSGIIIILSIGVYAWLRSGGFLSLRGLKKAPVITSEAKQSRASQTEPQSNQPEIALSDKERPPRNDSRIQRYAMLLFIAGVMMCAAILAGYQWRMFGNPFFPAQHYMPATTYSSSGYQGMDFPQPDLLWENAFGMRYGLFLSAPILLLALYIPGWFPRRKRLIGNLETGFVLVFTLAFFLFTAANQFSRMQFNSGVRHMLPVVPFLFLLCATVLLQVRSWLAWVIGLVATYWSWCLAMYRDVEQGWGIFESILHITRSGVRLPWLATLEALGYVPHGLAWLVLALMGLLIILIWWIPRKKRINKV